MAFEETLVCDGCSRVIDGGSRETTLGTLRVQAGRAFFAERRASGTTYREAEPDEPWGSTRRHLGGCCSGVEQFFDGTPVPSAEESS